MSSSNTHETEELIVKLLKKLERKGKNIHSFLWKLMDQFEDEQFDEKNDQKDVNNNQKKITLLYDETDKNVCKVGHYINCKNQKHLSVEPCILCGHRNNNIQHKTAPNKKQILQFLDNYNTNEIPFGPQKNQKRAIEAWASKGRDKEWPLHYASVTGDIVTINALVQNNNNNIEQKRTDQNDKTPIIYAARYGQLESMIELIKHGANPMQPPDQGNETVYKDAVYWKHKAIIEFLHQYIKYLYNFDVNDTTNVECYKCYSWDLHFNKHLLDGTMSKYVCCTDCTSENVRKVQKIQTNNLVIERRIIKTIKENPSISVDTLCQMKDVKSLHSILKEIMVSGAAYAYWLWLLDIDNFKAINTHLTHAVADTKIQAVGQVLKDLETITWTQWARDGYSGLYKVYAFRQGGDEFALVTHCNAQKIHTLQKLYERLTTDINSIKLENMEEMDHITVSIGVCNGQEINNYEEMMQKADEATEMVKNDGKNGIVICCGFREKIYKKFTDI